MDGNKYQKEVIKTAIYEKRYGVFYTALGLAGEAGEIANKVKKIIRDDYLILTQEKQKELQNEVGDVMWYVAAFCNEIGIDLNTVMKQNIEKLRDRQNRGVLKGSGDNR